MSTTTESVSALETETSEEGTQIKGKDFIYLNAPAIEFPENASLHNTDKRELFAILDELFQDGGGGGDEWQTPANWIPVPEPEPYDIYILILATRSGYGNTGMNFELMLGRESDNGIGYGNIFCDWGDGTVTDYNGMGYPQHTYTEEGQYLIHIVADENSSCWRSSSDNQAAWQIVKTGANIAFVTDYNEQNGYYPYGNLFPNKNYLKYVQINHPKGLPTSTKDSLFQGCNALRKIDLKKKISGNILRYTFQNCYGLSDFDEILNGDEIKSIGDYAFQGCYNLQKITVAQDCTFGTNCFQNCYSLYPRPDGSVN